MKKRHSISQRKCEQGLVAFYGYGDGYEVEVENGFVIEGE